MSRRLTGIAVGVLIGGLSVASVAATDASARAATDSTTRLAAADLTVSVPPVVSAGEMFDVLVGGLSAGDAVELLIRGTYASRSIPFTAESSDATVALDTADLGVGLVVIDVISRQRVGTAVVDVTPGNPAGPLDLYLGPRTVVADGEDHSMIVTVPVDGFGNPVASGTAVTHVATLADGTMAALETRTVDLLSFATIPSTTISGRTVIAVSVGDATGPGRSFENVAGPPVDFELEAERLAGTTTTWTADGTTLRTIRTSRLVDRFDNVVEDGTTVTLDLDGPDGTSILTATTIDGIARFIVESPSRPGTITASAAAAEGTSSDLIIDAVPAIDGAAVDARRIGDRVVVDVGPVLLTTGFFVPDGTVATVTIGEVRSDVVLDEGRGSFVADDAPAAIGDEVHVEIFGVGVTTSIGADR